MRKAAWPIYRAGEEEGGGGGHLRVWKQGARDQTAHHSSDTVMPISLSFLGPPIRRSLPQLRTLTSARISALGRVVSFTPSIHCIVRTRLRGGGTAARGGEAVNPLHGAGREIRSTAWGETCLLCRPSLTLPQAPIPQMTTTAFLPFSPSPPLPGTW